MALLLAVVVVVIALFASLAGALRELGGCGVDGGD